MTLVSYIRLLLRFKWVLLSAPILVACSVYFGLRGQPDEFASSSVIYTGLVSGFNIESGSDSRLDYNLVNSGFDNLITTIQSRQTLLSVTADLLTNVACGQDDYSRLADDPGTVALFEHVKGLSNGGCAGTRERIETEIASGAGVLYDAVYSNSGPFSLASMAGHMTVRRINSSDLLEIRFTASDPDFAHDFLTILNDSFIERYQRIKRKEVGSVVSFFEAETTRSYERLQSAVERMRSFGTENRVINYYEQTKAIAGQKELIDQQIQQETMRLEAAESAVFDLENRIGASEEIRRRGEQLVALRQRYAELTARQVIDGTVKAGGTTGANDPLPEMTMQIEQSVSDLYDARYSKEGLVKTELVERWLGEMVTLAQTRASLQVLQDRRTEYIKVYDEFAPLGSTLSTLEREVDVAEGEYLELLHSLNQARMRQQNIEMSSSMEVLDPPSYPHEPLGSKLAMLLAAAFMVTALLGVGLVTAIELLDESLRAPSEARKRTGMDVLGFIPTIEGNAEQSWEDPNVRRSVQVLAARLKTVMAKNRDKETHLICLVSAKAGEGKTTVGGLLHQALTESSRHVIRLAPSHKKEAEPQTADTKTFRVNADYAATYDIKQLMQLPAGEQVVILMELPSLAENEMPVSLLSRADSILWVARAGSLWTELEASTLKFARETGGIDPLLCLNDVQPERLEGAMGEVNKQRSAIRRAAKRLLNRNFS